MGVQKKTRKFVRVSTLIMREGSFGLMKALGEKNNWPTGCSTVGFHHEKLMYLPQQLIFLQEEKPAQG